MAARALYPRLLGPAWETLDEAVRRAHTAGSAAGSFRVWCAPGLAARALCWLVRLPPAGEKVDTRLVVTEERGKERWERSFGARPLVSEESAGRDGLLVERAPPVELRFRLEPRAGALHFRHVDTALRLGALRFPLPAFLAPRVTATESPAGNGAVRVEVTVRAPLLGPIFGYEGTVVFTEGPP
ncbi:MAG TPA: DUF4166 domain-containing protein [Thermoanaerobaculia bacterium]|nr:DUF4166 domain-containing protein [Thermoanaerobaculia bacterium]